jgi:hypothetical protein
MESLNHFEIVIKIDFVFRPRAAELEPQPRPLPLW